MKKLLIITGDPATGKTTFMKICSLRYLVHGFCKDEIKELLADNIGFADSEDNMKLSKAASEMLYHIFCEFSQQRADIILEGRFRNDELSKIYEESQKYDYDVTVITMIADLRTTYERYARRMISGERHPVHHIDELKDMEAYRKYIEEHSRYDFKASFVAFNASDFRYQDDPALFCILDKFFDFHMYD